MLCGIAHMCFWIKKGNKFLFLHQIVNGTKFLFLHQITSCCLTRWHVKTNQISGILVQLTKNVVRHCSHVRLNQKRQYHVKTNQTWWIKYDFAPNDYDFVPNLPYQIIMISHQISLRFRTKFITISHQISYDFAPNW